MYFPFPVDLTNNSEQAEMFQDSMINNEYYYLVENGNANIDYQLRSLDPFKAAKKVSAFSSCNLVLLGKSRNQMMPPHFGVKYDNGKAIIVEFICYLLNDESIENDVLMLIQYLQAKHSDIKELSIPSSIRVDSDLYEITSVNGEKIIAW